MDNLHRQRISRGQWNAVLAAAGIDPGHVRWSCELGDATFNTVYRVHLDEAATARSSAVLKIAPRPDTPVLRYENGIMRTEAGYYRAAAGRAPLPDVLCADFTREAVGSDFLLLSDLPGTNWHTERERISQAERAQLRTELGAMVAALHGVSGTAFGYPQTPGATSWPAAFTAMVDAVLADADTFGIELPVPPGRIRAAVAASTDALSEVQTPVLVHFDLWDGNILVDRAQGCLRVSGLVDGERAFWGDPLADLVSLALFDDIESDESFLYGYRAGGGRGSFDAGDRRRLSLYRCYLYLIMLVEGVPRGYSGAEANARSRFVSRHLRTEMDSLPGAADVGTPVHHASRRDQ